MLRQTRRSPLTPPRQDLAPGVLFATSRFEPAVVLTNTGSDFTRSYNWWRRTHSVCGTLRDI